MLSSISSPRRGLAAIGLALLAGFVALSPVSTSAAPVLDQQNLGPLQGNVGIGPTLSRGQSFTVGVDGLLAGFEFHFNKSSAFATGNAYLSLYSTDGGGAPDTLLGQAVLAAASVSTTSGFHYFDLLPLNVAVTTGDLMFAALSADFGGGTFASLDVYAAGSEWGCGPAFGIVCWTEADNRVPDLFFRSYVEIAEPGAIVPLVAGLTLIGIVRRRRR
jgi:hypothetical protein